MPDAMDGIITMQRLSRRAGPNVERQTDAQQRVDGVVLDAVLANRAELVLQDMRTEALQHGRLAELCDRVGFADQSRDGERLLGDDGQGGLLGAARLCAVRLNVVVDLRELLGGREVAQDHPAVLF